MIDRKLLFALGGLLAACACTSPPGDVPEARELPRDRHSRVSLTAEAYERSGIVVEPVGRGDYAPAIRVTGTLTYDERTMGIAAARIGGRITEVAADYGQEVSQGEVLAWIDSPELGAAQAGYLRARSMTRLREAEYERARLLVEGDAISRGELLRREAEWRAAQAEVRTAEQKLHILGLSQQDVESLPDRRAGGNHVYPVRAPIDGRVTERKAVPGRVVSPDEELFTVARLDSLWLFLQVFEKDLPAVRKGATVSLTCESHPRHRFRGTVDFVGEVLDPHSRTVQVRAVIDNPDGKLKPGMFVYASIQGRREDGEPEAAVAIPASAMAKLDGRDVVFVQTSGRTFEARPVVTGDTGHSWTEIRSGLDEGERIAVEGTFVLKSELLKGGLEEHGH